MPRLAHVARHQRTHIEPECWLGEARHQSVRSRLDRRSAPRSSERAWRGVGRHLTEPRRAPSICTGSGRRTASPPGAGRGENKEGRPEAVGEAPSACQPQQAVLTVRAAGVSGYAAPRGPLADERWASGEPMNRPELDGRAAFPDRRPASHKRGA